MPEGPVNATVGGANTTKVLSNWAEHTRLSSPWTYSTDLVTSNTVESAMTSNDVWLLGTLSNSRPVVAKKEYDVLEGESPSFKSKKSTVPPSQKTGATVNSGDNHGKLKFRGGGAEVGVGRRRREARREGARSWNDVGDGA